MHGNQLEGGGTGKVGNIKDVLGLPLPRGWPSVESKPKRTKLNQSNPSDTPHVDLLKLFRMPWSMSDNAFSWLEPTRYCDLDCPYCYQIHDPNSHKTLRQFEDEVLGLLRLRKSDAVVIAGGEPLTHPDIVEMVRIAARHIPKALLLTNGTKMTPELVDSLKKAGLKGFFFHIDRCQNRPGWIGKTESELNVLRQKLADMVYEAGGLFCAFNATILPATLEEVPDIVRWIAANAHKVHLGQLIPVRVPHKDEPFEFYAGGNKVDPSQLPFFRQHFYRKMTAAELHQKILQVLPQFRFNSYLAGTLRSDVPKWLFGNTIGIPAESYGGAGPKAMEILQSMHHLIRRRYLGLLSPWQYRSAQLLFLLAPFDKEIRRTMWRSILGVLRHPLRVLQRLHVQTIVLMQPQDMLEDGEQDVCDGCPNKTMWQGRLVSECRLEEHIRFGRLLTMARKPESPEEHPQHKE